MLNISAERHPVSGAWIISAIIRGHLITRTYYGYTKQNAIRDFRNTQNPCHAI